MIVSHVTIDPMAKKTIISDDNAKIIPITSIAWLTIPLWIVLVILGGQTGFLSSWLGSLNAENTNIIVGFILLVPIALLSFPLTYKMDLSHYTVEKPFLKFSIWARGLISLFATAIILTISWYLYIVISVVLHFQFGI